MSFSNKIITKLLFLLIPMLMDRKILIESGIIYELLYISSNFNIDFNKFKHKFMLFFGHYQSIRPIQNQKPLSENQVKLIINFNISFYFMTCLFQFIKSFKPSFDEIEALMKVFVCDYGINNSILKKYFSQEIGNHFSKKMESLCNTAEKEQEYFQFFFLFELLYIFVDSEDFIHDLIEKFNLKQLFQRLNENLNYQNHRNISPQLSN